MLRFPFLVYMPLPPLNLLLPRLLTVMMKFPLRVFHTILLWFRVVVLLRFLSCTPVFLAFPPPSLLLFALNMPCRLAAAADALSSMVNSDLLLLLLHARASYQSHTESLTSMRIQVHANACIRRFSRQTDKPNR
jgi:hypothetical protein